MSRMKPLRQSEFKMRIVEDLGMLYATSNSKKKVRHGMFECLHCKKVFRSSVGSAKHSVTMCGSCSTRMTSTTHGLSHTKIHAVWKQMLARCHTPSNISYTNYGGRGITVCKEWRDDFVNFYAWAMSNGYSSALSLDRINNDGNYEPSNCRYVAPAIQSTNQRVRKTNRSGYTGVFKYPSGNYFSYIARGKKRVGLGTYPTKKEALTVRNNYIIENKLPHKVQEYKGELDE